MRTVFGVVVLFCVLGSGYAAVIYPTPGGDGMVGRDWYVRPAYHWVVSDGREIQAYHDSDMRWYYRGMAIFDIASLMGRTLGPSAVTFNFFSHGFSGTTLEYANVWSSELTTNYVFLRGNFVADLGPVGWQRFDVTPYVQNSVNTSNRYVALLFVATQNYGGGSAASVESGMGPYLLLSDAGNPIPEPSSLALLALGLSGLAAAAFWRRRRQA